MQVLIECGRRLHHEKSYVKYFHENSERRSEKSNSRNVMEPFGGRSVSNFIMADTKKVAKSNPLLVRVDKVNKGFDVVTI